jgi:cell division protein FtsW
LTSFRLGSAAHPGQWDGARRPERPSGPIDSTVLFVVVTLVLIGVTLVYATTCHKGVAFLKSQGLRAAAGFLALYLGAKLRYTIWNGKTKWAVLICSIAALVLTLAIGFVFKDAKRWMQLGPFMFQPAEFAKFGLLAWLAGYFDTLKELGKDQHGFWGFLLPGTVVLGVVVLTLLQPAVGTSFMLAVASVALFVIVGVKWWRLGVTLGVGVVLFVLAITCIPHARDRWAKFRIGKHRQQEQSLIAIGSGGPVGRGLGESRQKFQFLPKMYNDFIFAEIGEEFGFIGSAAVCLLYLILFLYGMRISSEARTPFGQYLAAGITFVIFLYAIVHIAVALGLIPTTGQPLPFVSSGGSALLSNLFAVGILLNISRYRRNRVTVDLPQPSRGSVLRFGLAAAPARHKVLVLGRFGGRV